jgi:hypothetical protein
MNLVKKHADEIREIWQSRALRASTGKLRKVLIVALAKEYPAALITLAKVSFPGFVDFDLPVLLSYATIGLDGSLLCKMKKKDGTIGWVRIYDNEDRFLYETRKLADGLKLSDRERIEMFTVLQKWVASDKRVGIHGQRLAS